MLDHERVRLQLMEMTQPLVDEPLVTVAAFFREGMTQDSWRKGPLWLRRTFAPRDDVPGDQLGTTSLVALTATRVLIVKAAHGRSGLAPQRVIGAWPHATVRWGREALETDSSSEERGTTYTRITRITLSFTEGTQPLGMDFLRRDKAVKGLAAALEAALGPRSGVR